MANLVQMWHLPYLHHICYSFGPDLFTFALRKYGVKAFFRPVLAAQTDKELVPLQPGEKYTLFSIYFKKSLP